MSSVLFSFFLFISDQNSLFGGGWGSWSKREDWFWVGLGFLTVLWKNRDDRIGVLGKGFGSWVLGEGYWR